MKRLLSIEVEFDVDSAAERAVADWLRTWRRREVRSNGKARYPYQEVVKLLYFQAPAEAVADLEARLRGYPASAVRRLASL